MFKLKEDGAFWVLIALAAGFMWGFCCARNEIIKQGHQMGFMVEDPSTGQMVWNTKHTDLPKEE